MTKGAVESRVREYRRLNRVRNARKEKYPSRAYIDYRKREIFYELLEAGYDLDGNPRGGTDSK